MPAQGPRFWLQHLPNVGRSPCSIGKGQGDSCPQAPHLPHRNLPCRMWGFVAVFLAQELGRFPIIIPGEWVYRQAREVWVPRASNTYNSLRAWDTSAPKFDKAFDTVVGGFVPLHQNDNVDQGGPIEPQVFVGKKLRIQFPVPSFEDNRRERSSSWRNIAIWFLIDVLPGKWETMKTYRLWLIRCVYGILLKETDQNLSQTLAVWTRSM